MTTADLRLHRDAFGLVYRSALHRSLDAAAVPYGYTVLTAAAGGMLIQTHGAPAFGEAALYVVGAVTAFALVAVLGTAESAPTGGVNAAAAVGHPWMGLASGIAAMVGFCLAALIGHTIHAALA
jgi:hypothetical protein